MSQSKNQVSQSPTSGIPRLVNTDLRALQTREGWQVTDLDELSGATLGIMSSFFVNSSFSRPGHHSTLFALSLHFVTP